MNKLKLAICFLIILLVTTALTCDRQYNIIGIVKYQSTNKPISKAEIKVLKDSVRILTDENGYFQINRYCENLLKFRIDKSNYKTFEIEIDESAESVKYEVTNKSEFIEFKKPFFPNPKNNKMIFYGIDIERNSKSFTIRNDTFIFYLDTVDYKTEVKNKLQELSVFSLK